MILTCILFTVWNINLWKVASKFGTEQGGRGGITMWYVCSCDKRHWYIPNEMAKKNTKSKCRNLSESNVQNHRSWHTHTHTHTERKRETERESTSVSRWNKTKGIARNYYCLLYLFAWWHHIMRDCILTCTCWFTKTLTNQPTIRPPRILVVS